VITVIVSTPPGGRGTGNGAVARRLYIPPTVNTHLRRVFAKLGMPDRVALAAVAHHSIKSCLGRWPSAQSDRMNGRRSIDE
jgi:Bacterial regulatory proteins, luxR family